MKLFDDERIDYVNDRLSLIQKEGGLTFGTDALLLAGYADGKYKSGLELGAGSGIISMLLLTRDKLLKATLVEVQKEYAELSARNAELNKLNDRITVYSTDLREFAGSGEYDLIYTNPPYMTTKSGKLNESAKKNIARHEVFGDIYDFCSSGARLLRYGGTFLAVYRTDRLVDLLDAMRKSAIEPKRLTFVHANQESVPSMVLVEGKRGGKSGLRVTKPLFIYSDCDNNRYSSDMEYIMENGSFPNKFRVR